LSLATRDREPAAAVDVILRDGSTLRLRAPAREDASALAAFLTGLSERSFYQRFHGVRAIDEELVTHFLETGCATRSPRRLPSRSRTSFRGAG
jgi:hypothetical protein